MIAFWRFGPFGWPSQQLLPLRRFTLLAVGSVALGTVLGRATESTTTDEASFPSHAADIPADVSPDSLYTGERYAWMKRLTAGSDEGTSDRAESVLLLERERPNLMHWEGFTSLLDRDVFARKVSDYGARTKGALEAERSRAVNAGVCSELENLDIHFDREIGYVIEGILPHAFFLHLHGCLNSTAGAKGSESFVIFNPDHIVLERPTSGSSDEEKGSRDRGLSYNPFVLQAQKLEKLAQADTAHGRALRKYIQECKVEDSHMHDSHTHGSHTHDSYESGLSRFSERRPPAGWKTDRLYPDTNPSAVPYTAELLEHFRNMGLEFAPPAEGRLLRRLEPEVSTTDTSADESADDMADVVADEVANKGTLSQTDKVSSEDVSNEGVSSGDGTVERSAAYDPASKPVNPKGVTEISNDMDVSDVLLLPYMQRFAEGEPISAFHSVLKPGYGLLWPNYQQFFEAAIFKELFGPPTVPSVVSDVADSVGHVAGAADAVSNSAANAVKGVAGAVESVAGAVTSVAGAVTSVAEAVNAVSAVQQNLAYQSGTQYPYPYPPPYPPFPNPYLPGNPYLASTSYAQGDAPVNPSLVSPEGAERFPFYQPPFYPRAVPMKPPPVAVVLGKTSSEWSSAMPYNSISAPNTLVPIVRRLMDAGYLVVYNRPQAKIGLDFGFVSDFGEREALLQTAEDYYRETTWRETSSGGAEREGQKLGRNLATDGLAKGGLLFLDDICEAAAAIGQEAGYTVDLTDPHFCNVVMLHLYANTDFFVGAQGGASIIAGLFGKDVILLVRKGSEILGLNHAINGEPQYIYDRLGAMAGGRYFPHHDLTQLQRFLDYYIKDRQAAH